MENEVFFKIKKKLFIDIIAITVEIMNLIEIILDKYNLSQ